MGLERDDFLRVYHPVHLHFTTAYNCLKYGSKVPSLPNITDKSNDIRMRVAASNFDTPDRAFKFCIANFACGEMDWLYGDLASAKLIALDWRKRTLNLTKTITEDYNTFIQAKEASGVKTEAMLSKTKNGNLPPLLQMCLEELVSREFVCIMNSKLCFLDRWQAELDIDPLATKEVFRLIKYEPFVVAIKNQQAA